MRKTFLIIFMLLLSVSVYAAGKFDEAAEVIADRAARSYDAPIGRYPNFYSTSLKMEAIDTSTGKKYVFDSQTCGDIMNALIVHLYEELNGDLWWEDRATAWGRKAKLDLMKIGLDNGEAELFMAHGRNKVVEIYMQKYSR